MLMVDGQNAAMVIREILRQRVLWKLGIQYMNTRQRYEIPMANHACIEDITVQWVWNGSDAAMVSIEWSSWSKAPSVASAGMKAQKGFVHLLVGLRVTAGERGERAAST